MFILLKDNLSSKFSAIEVLAMILAAVIHDVGHPGVTNPFLRASKVRFLRIDPRILNILLL
jgi:hypothetical protein